MKAQLNSRVLKTAGAAVIVLAAFLIMMPTVFGYVAGLWRIGLFVGAALLSAWIISLVLARLSLPRQSKRN